MAIDFTLKVGDIAPAISQQLLDNDGNIMPLIDGDEVRLWVGLVNENFTYFEKTAEIVNLETAIVLYQWVSGDTADACLFDGEWRIYRNNIKRSTFPNGYCFKIEINKKIE